MSDEERERMWEAASPEYRNFKMIERLTEKVGEINNATQEKIEFIVNQQAQFAANQQKVEERVSKIEDLIVRLGNFTIDKTSALSEDVDRKISALVDSQIQTEESIKNLTAEIDRKIAALVDSQIQTEERLRNLTANVDRYFNEGRNGQS